MTPLSSLARPLLGPDRRLRVWIATLVIALSGVAALYRSLLEPSLGWRFVQGPQDTVRAMPLRPGLPVLGEVMALEAGGESVALNADLVIESAGIHNAYAAHNAFFAEHQRIWRLLEAPVVRIRHDAGVIDAVPQPRAVAELGLRFWFPWLVALLSLSVGLAIWVYQPRGSATLCYLLASGGYAFGMLCTASWGSRLLTQPPQAWAALHVASHLGTFLVTAGLSALLWLHPRRLGGPWLLWLVAAVVTLSVAADALQWVPTISLAFRLPVVLLTAALGLLFALQWRACRHDATQRAQLKWFGLLLLAGLSTVFVAYAVGATGRVVNIPQNYGLGTVALLFLGLVPLVTRIGLFQLEAWWPRAWLWFVGGVLVVALDLVLVSALDWASDTALAVALALAGWVYFPLRQLVWNRLGRGQLPSTRDVLPQVLDLVTQARADPALLNAHWARLWDQVFEPARMRPAPPGAESGTAEQGRLLRVAAGPDLPMLELELPERGSRLFNPADARRAAEICELVDRGLASARAFEEGAREERRRIASDLHDDLGAQLLTIAQISRQPGQGERVSGLARQALDDMRLAVRGLTGEAVGMAEALADWRAETVTRLTTAGLVADWQAEEPPAGVTLPARSRVQLTRILREAISNVIRHAGASRCTVHVAFEPDLLSIEVADDGRGLPAAAGAGHGHGLASIERRVRSLGGTHAFRPGEPGTRLQVRVPLAPA
ncbi:sensor histidine kinase [Ramlibacter sp.]|uniref:sensor histidine kinase n=1 Tax=Ramlibacter sp. TaxID=1917967 RepID=UPI0035B3D3B6